MKLVKATQQDFPRIAKFYQNVIEQTVNMGRYARWIYGQHPTDHMIQRYIQTGAMYYSQEDGVILSAVAVTPQTEEYHDAAWSISLRDDEVAVVHLLCVAPERQRQGIARQTMGGILALAQETEKKHFDWMLWLAIYPPTGFMKLWDSRNGINGYGLRIMWVGLISTCLSTFCDAVAKRRMHWSDQIVASFFHHAHIPSFVLLRCRIPRHR